MIKNNLYELGKQEKSIDCELEILRWKKIDLKKNLENSNKDIVDLKQTKRKTRGNFMVQTNYNIDSNQLL